MYRLPSPLLETSGIRHVVLCSIMAEDEADASYEAAILGQYSPSATYKDPLDQNMRGRRSIVPAQIVAWIVLAGFKDFRLAT